MKSLVLFLFQYIATATAASSVCNGNTATTRSQWCNYSIGTDYTTTVPDTNVTREYWFNLEQVTVAPDGRPRTAMAINGSIPGPTFEADWGDTVIVHLTNSLPASVKYGTSMHFHGIRQSYNNPLDGVVSITQCPTAPGSSMTYKWRTMQYGSTWYHSHIGLQAWEGLFGGILIHGPASANYDEDLGMLFLNDWDISTVDELYTYAQAVGPPTLDNGLINGTNVYGETGFRFNTSFVEGTSYRLRLVNAAVDTHFKFMVDNHTLTVMASDLVPIKPYETTVLDIAMGQRYDVIITADQAAVADSFWLRAIPQSACSENESADNIKGIIYYGASTSTPTTAAYAYTDGCNDEDPANLTPVVNPRSATTSPFYTKAEPATLGTNADTLFRWKLNSTSMQIDWADPTLLQVYNNKTAFSNTSGVVELPEPNKWVYVVIETDMPVPHPIHLHGHEFVIIAQGTGSYNAGDNLVSTLGAAALPRRDTAILKENGYLVIAFFTDNPPFAERYADIQMLVKDGYYGALESGCEAWAEYQEEYMVEEDDSGV